MARKNPRRNISRIEISNADTDKTYGGWQVRFQRRGVKTDKFFSDIGYGGKRAALQAAKELRDSLEASTAKLTVAEKSTEPSIRNRSGIVGVRMHQQKDRRGDTEYQYWYWIAQWTDGRGRRRTRSFSVHRHGEEEAFQMAVKARKQGLAQAKR